MRLLSAGSFGYFERNEALHAQSLTPHLIHRSSLSAVGFSSSASTGNVAYQGNKTHYHADSIIVVGNILGKDDPFYRT